MYKEITLENHMDFLPERYEATNNRNLFNYQYKLSAYEGSSEKKFMEFLLSKSDEKSAKIRWLDCGAGIGTALKEAMSREEPLAELAVGISKHSLKNLEETLKSSRNIKWYLGDAVEILPEMEGKFDLITDVFGAFFYSKDRLDILEQYHRLLEDGGKAFILASDADNLHARTKDLVIDGRKRLLLEEYLCDNYPYIFSAANEGHTLLVENHGERFPEPKLELKEMFYSKIDALDNNKYGHESSKCMPLVPVNRYSII